jgi:hypothetical protein
MGETKNSGNGEHGGEGWRRERRGDGNIEREFGRFEKDGFQVML